MRLVSRIRNSLCFAARSGANFGFDKDTSKLMFLVSFMVQKFARQTRHSRSRNGVASLAFGWSEFLNHHPGAWTHKSAVSALPAKADLRADAPRCPQGAISGPRVS